MKYSLRDKVFTLHNGTVQQGTIIETEERNVSMQIGDTVVRNTFNSYKVVFALETEDEEGNVTAVERYEWFKRKENELFRSKEELIASL